MRRPDESDDGGVRDYYSAGFNDWVKRQLSVKGIKFQEMSGIRFTAAQPPPLYADVPGQYRITGGGEGTVEDGLDCVAVSEPMVIVGASSSCSVPKVCHMRVKCTEYSGGQVVHPHGEMDAVCKSTGDGACPSATECATDGDVTMEKAALTRSAQGGTGSKGARSVR